MSGTWTPLTNQPTFNASTMLLLTDGTVMCQDAGVSNWWKVTPDAFGSYVNGTWSQLAPMMNAPLYYASAVLADGRVFIAGGEYNAGNPVDLLAAEIYDPVANTWTSLSTPAGWTNIGDAPCCVFPDGRVMIGSILDTRTAIYDPVANTWTAGANKHDPSSEETWTLLPDSTILVAECSNHPQSEKYVIATNQWVEAGQTASDLVETASIEIGPQILLTDGRVFAIGATSNTSLYIKPATATDAGTWVNGPTFPPQTPNQALGAKDAPACLLPNGRVLCVAGPVDGVSGDYLSPTYFFEFDPISLTLTTIPNPPNNYLQPYNGRMLLLPTSEVLFANGTMDIELYSPDGKPATAWQPRITNCPTSLKINRTYTLSGTQLNGLSQAVSYGDDATMATNYPLLSIRNLASNKVVYCRTFNHYMGVATGNAVHTTEFTVPHMIEQGASELYVIANGISSDPLAVTIGRQACNRTISSSADGRLELFATGKDGALWHLEQTAVNNGWSNWNSVGTASGGFTSSPVAGPSADGRLELFATGKDGNLWHLWQTAVNNGWSSWYSHGSAGGGFTGSPIIGPSADGRLELFAIGKDGALWHLWQSAVNNGWSSWYSHGTAGGGFSGSPTVAPGAVGRLELFVIGKDGALWHLWQTAINNGWSSWYSHGSAGGGFSGSPIVTVNADGRLEVFVIGKDGALWHLWQTAPNAGWSGWNSAGTAGVGFTGSITIAQDADGRLEVFTMGKDGALWHMWQTAATNGWSNWYSHGSAGGGFTGPLAIAQDLDGRLELFVRGNDSALWHLWQTATNNGWSNWYSHGDAGVGFAISI